MKHIAEQATLALEIKEEFAPLYIVVATYKGRGPEHGKRKVFPKPHSTIEAAIRAAERLPKRWRHRRIYQLEGPAKLNVATNAQE